MAMLNEKRINMAFANNAIADLTGDEVSVVAAAKGLFRETMRKSAGKRSRIYEEGISDAAVAAACVCLTHARSQQSGAGAVLRDKEIYQRASTLPKDRFNICLWTATKLAQRDHPYGETDARSSPAISSAKAKGKQRAVEPETRSPSASTRSADKVSPSVSKKTPTKRGHVTLQHGGDKSAAMNAHTAQRERDAAAAKSAASTSTSISTPAHTPTKPSSLRREVEEITPTKSKAGGSAAKKRKIEATPQSIKSAAKKAERRAEASEAARRAPPRLCMVPDYDLMPAWPQDGAAWATRVKAVRARFDQAAA